MCLIYHDITDVSSIPHQESHGAMIGFGRVSQLPEATPNMFLVEATSYVPFRTATAAPVA